MMAKLTLHCDVWGSTFSPSSAEARTGLIFACKAEPGSIGTRGRYRGKPTLYGSATLEMPEDMPWSERWQSLTDTLALHIQTLRECGAESIVLDHAYYHEGQCNHEFTPEQLRQVADLGIPFIMSCYDLEFAPD